MRRCRRGQSGREFVAQGFSPQQFIGKMAFAECEHVRKGYSGQFMNKIGNGLDLNLGDFIFMESMSKIKLASEHCRTFAIHLCRPVFVVESPQRAPKHTMRRPPTIMQMIYGFFPCIRNYSVLLTDVFVDRLNC